MTSDGFALFIWDDNASAVRKIGTGNNGTIQGAELICNTNIVSQIKEILAPDVPAVQNMDDLEQLATVDVLVTDTVADDIQCRPAPRLLDRQKKGGG